MVGLATFPDASPAAVAAALGVSLRTARRFKAAGKLPFPYALMWELLGAGNLGAAFPEWRGWIVRAGQLVSPEGWTFSAGEVRAMPLRYAQLRELEHIARDPAQLLLSV